MMTPRADFPVTNISGGGAGLHIQSNAAAIAPDSTCGSEFSDSGSSSVSDDVAAPSGGRRIVGVGGGGMTLATLMEKDDGDEIGTKRSGQCNSLLHSDALIYHVKVIDCKERNLNLHACN